MENYKTVSREDMWKLSVNFKVPEWAKGGIMYHIFVDRFFKGRNILLPRISNRSFLYPGFVFLNFATFAK